jgi:hypothetical protein
VFAILLKEAKVRALCPHAVPSSITHSPRDQSPRDALLSCPRRNRADGWLSERSMHMPGSVPIRPMVATRMQAGPPPQATTSPQDITSEVSADVVSRP